LESAVELQGLSGKRLIFLLPFPSSFVFYKQNAPPGAGKLSESGFTELPEFTGLYLLGDEIFG
jgi:hypothetical protein